MTAAGRALQARPMPADAPTHASIVDFGGLEIAYDDRVLEPRAWTAMQSRWAADLLDGDPAARILELCAGAGHIGLLATSLSGASLVCLDLNPVACDFARANAERAGLAGRVEVRCAPLEEAGHQGDGLPETFDLVIADPPWVLRAELDRFPDDPTLAIDGGDDGLDVARACVVRARAALSVGGDLLVQLGDEPQAGALGTWAAERGWRTVEVRQGERGVVLHLVAE